MLIQFRHALIKSTYTYTYTFVQDIYSVIKVHICNTGDGVLFHWYWIFIGEAPFATKVDQFYSSLSCSVTYNLESVSPFSNFLLKLRPATRYSRLMIFLYERNFLKYLLVINALLIEVFTITFITEDLQPDLLSRYSMWLKKDLSQKHACMNLSLCAFVYIISESLAKGCDLNPRAIYARCLCT